jgi:uncharacterized protein (TIGR00251 family)
MKITETKAGTIVELFVKPNSPKFEFKIENEEILVFSTQEPVKGKVNKELVKELTKLFHQEVEIISGLTSKQKKFLIKSVRKNDVERLLRAV